MIVQTLRSSEESVETLKLKRRIFEHGTHLLHKAT
jgi:hypothetical protein